MATLSGPTLDLLMQMQEDWQATSASLVDLAVATTLRQHDSTRIVLSEADMRATLQAYVVRRELVLGADGAQWEISITPRDVVARQGDLPI